MSDLINNPAHYTQQPIECIEITEHLNFNLGNAVKYLWRYEDKAKPLDDLKKARYYLERQINSKPNFKSLDRCAASGFRLNIAECKFNGYQLLAIHEIINYAERGDFMALYVAVDMIEAAIEDLSA